MDDIVVATSVAPTGWDRQESALSSWRAAGVELHTLNAQSEIPAIQARIAELGITAFPVQTTDYRGKPLPLIDDFVTHFRALRRPARYYGIINSDVALTDASRLSEIVRRTDASLIFGRRMDVTGDASEGSPSELGYDFFFLASDALSSVPESRFRIGVPWWDYWLPMCQLVMSRKIAQVSPPLVSHVVHPLSWDQYALYDMGVHYLGLLLDMRRSHVMSPECGQALFGDMFEKTAKRVYTTWNGMHELLTSKSWDVDAQLRFKFGILRRIRSAAGAGIRALLNGPQAAEASAMIWAISDLAHASVKLIDSVSAQALPESEGMNLCLSAQGQRVG